MDEFESSPTTREYLAILRRRKVQILAATAIVAAVGVVVAIALPPTYRSSATVLVQEQEVPPDLVRSTITSFADERIQVISQQVMTRAVLLQLVEKYGLYEKYRQRATNDEVVALMQKNINLTTVNADISDRSSGRRVNATIAFRISFSSPDPDSAQKVAAELADLYLAENAKVRQQSVDETTAFLTQEADRLAKQIQDIEGNLAQFKRRNAGRLPESSVLNMQLAERTGSELMRIEREMSSLQERKFASEAQLATVPRYAPLAANVGEERTVTLAERLRVLQAQYASASGLYGADHPDIRRMRREIAALSAEIGVPDKESDSAEKLTKLESDLAALRERYSEDHPDIQRTKRSIATLKASLTKPATGSGAAEKRLGTDPVQRPENPAYVVLMAQIEGTKRELARLAAQRDDLRAQQRTYDSRLLQIPEIEREYQNLTRDYQNAQTRYREIKAKQLQAEGSQELERDSRAERFSIGEPATRPERPISPNRPAIALLSLIAGLISGLSIAGWREAFDPSVKGPLELARLATVPILMVIPYIETRREQLVKGRKTWIIVWLTLLLVVAFLLGVHFFLKPLPTLLDSAMRRIVFW